MSRLTQHHPSSGKESTDPSNASTRGTVSDTTTFPAFLKKKKNILLKKYDRRLLHRIRGVSFPRITQLRYLTHFLSKKETRLIKIHASIFVFFLIVFLANGFFTHRTVTPARGGTYSEALLGNIQYINPLFSQKNDADADIGRLVFSGLLKYDTEGQLVPDLASDITTNASGTLYTFTLRKDVAWHDGEPFTATDVVFTFQTITDPEVGSPLRVSFQGIEVTAPDMHTVTFRLTKPFAPFLSTLTVGILPEHIWGTIEPANMQRAQANLKPIGTGPFMFSSLQKDSLGAILSYTLKRNDTFYDVPAYLEEIVFELHPDLDSAIDAVRSKKILGLNFISKEEKQRVERKHITLYTLRIPQYTAVFFNQKRNSLLKEDAVRVALAHAIDKPALIQEVLQGEGEMVEGPILPGFLGYTNELTSYPFDSVKANTILDEAKWERMTPEEYRTLRVNDLYTSQEKELTGSTHTTSTTEDAAKDLATKKEELRKKIEEQVQQEIDLTQPFFRKKKNTILSIHLSTVKQGELLKTAEFLKKSWQQIGIQVLLDALEPKQIQKEVIRPRNYDALVYGEIIGNDPDPFPFWHSSQNQDPGLNLAIFTDKKIDTLLENARNSTNEQERANTYSEFQKALSKNIPALFLFRPTYTYVVNKKVHGIPVTRITTPADRFTGIEKWYIKTKSIWK